MHTVHCAIDRIQIYHELYNQIGNFLIGISLSLDCIRNRNEFCFRLKKSFHWLKLKSIRTNDKIINNYMSTVIRSHNISTVINCEQLFAWEWNQTQNYSFSHWDNSIECSCFHRLIQIHSVRIFTTNSIICYWFQFWFDFFLLIRTINVWIKTNWWGCFYRFFLFSLSFLFHLFFWFSTSLFISTQGASWNKNEIKNS